VRPSIWAVVSSASALVSLVGGWVIAESVQPPGYDPVRHTISALARHGAQDRWIMSVALAAIGIGHLLTASLLTSLPRSSRVVLALGGCGAIGLTIFAQPPTGMSQTHLFFAMVGYLALAAWPLTTMFPDPAAPLPLRPQVAVAATAASFLMLFWILATSSQGTLGLAERMASFQQEAWPLLVVVALRRRPVAAPNEQVVARLRGLLSDETA
jgi:hypothetical membrane protein